MDLPLHMDGEGRTIMHVRPNRMGLSAVSVHRSAGRLPAALKRWGLRFVVWLGSKLRSRIPESARSRITPAARWLRCHKLGVVTVMAVVALFGRELAGSGITVHEWDLLFLSGSLTVIAGVWLAQGYEERFWAMTRRLLDRDALVIRQEGEPPRTVDEVSFSLIREEMKKRSCSWAYRSALLLSAAMVALFIGVYARNDVDISIVTGIGGTLLAGIAGVLVGRILGRMACYGRFAQMLANIEIEFRARPGHVDGAAGLKPVGDYYVLQALLLAIPAAFLLTWTVLLFSPPGRRDTRAGAAPTKDSLSSRCSLRSSRSLLPCGASTPT
jgi:hypothetical protein